MVWFQSSGQLGDLLQQLKKDFLLHLTPDDLKKEAILLIREKEDSSEEEDKSLKEKLIEVIDDG